MLRVAYLFERFPSFGQTFCYREVVELLRQGAEVRIFSIRRPSGEPAQHWDETVVARVHYLPGEAELVAEVKRSSRVGELPREAVRALKEWDRQSDFLRLYQGAYVGLQLRRAGVTRVHAHFAGMAARTAYWIRQFFAIDYSFTAHANDVFAPREFAVSLAKLVESAAAVVTVSDFSARDLQRRFPDAAAKIHRVYNGIELERFRPAEFSSGVPLILSVGRLIEKKGFGDLISACAELRDAGLPFRCEIIGEGPLEPMLAAQIANAGLGGSVRLLGPRSQEEIIELLTAARVFVLPCTKETDGGMDNLPTVIMEAMAAGLPVISTPLAGVPEMVEPGVTGALVPDRDPTALARAIADLLTDVAKAQQLGSHGRELAARRFSIETNVRALADVLRRGG